MVVLVGLVSVLAFNSYRLSNLVEKREVVIKSVTAERDVALASVQAMKEQQQQVAALDTKYTKELADAKSENERLRADLATGAKRLQLNATCSKSVSKATGPASVPDDASARLTNAAERDYLSLRERIGTATTQIAGLQSYITNVCLMPDK
ncbi:lysis protein [Yersinia ruckeri]|nr:lysis protein [Yersinia ruckeri]